MKMSFLKKKENLHGNEVGENQAQQEKPNERNVQLVDKIICSAVRYFASDVHIEKYAKQEIRVRIRIDGILKLLCNLKEKDYEGVISRIKILANMNIAERRKPQDGSFLTSVESEDIDVRVSSMPTIHGEKIVLRILNPKHFLININQLGFSKKDEKKVFLMTDIANGLILNAGPTGCGKTTTLYSLLQRKNSEDVNIMTIEDPIEYNLRGINQIQVNEKIDLTFEAGLRAILRQDPNIIMIGEIRDEITASTAVRAAITGHLVLSTIHTNDAVSTINRLSDMGVPSYLLATALRGIISQRLVRNLCKECKKPYKASEYERKYLNVKHEEQILYKPKGCSCCNYTGFKGRKGFYEVFEITSKIREAIYLKNSYDTLLSIGLDNGLVQFSTSIRKAILQGETSVEEGIKTMHYGIN
ncbi:MAG: GspE/PulE family protein [Eubacterium sp.]